MIPLLVHSTHEAAAKIGGIGAVLDGLLGAEAYNRGVARTILAGPLFADDLAASERPSDRPAGVTIRYSSLHGVYGGVDEPLRAALQQIEQTFEVALLYGTRRFGAYTHEVLLADAAYPNPRPLADFKYFLWQQYGIESARYGSAEYAKYMAIAQPLLAALHALAPAEPPGTAAGRLLLAHDWLGLPLLFAAQMEPQRLYRTVYYAHESPTARALIEQHPGHDTRFYNALFQARAWRLGLETVFGPQDASFKHVLVRQAASADAILAVGDLVVEELRFLGGGFVHAPIDLVYNGIPATAPDLAEKRASGALLRDYAAALLGWRPDFVFTHVGRLVLSKAFWRDARVMEHLDALLRSRGERAVLFVLATSAPAGKPAARVAAWEQEYGWPVRHRSDNGDLIDLEVAFDRDVVEPFNRRATNARIVFVNQYDWAPARNGTRMPADLSFADLRSGTDLEFGQSIYEPFGIAQLEPLAAGALCCFSNICGCVGALDKVAGGTEHLPNVVVADYCTLPPGYWLGSPYDALAIDQGVRDWLESANSATAARALFARLPRSDAESRTLLERGAEVARALGWESVVERGLLPALARAAHA